mmetsp:Transcript_103428/g.299232  ORF Transcript_103428/g.299232 Transcript_103428/m.299232 type:complete len:278 (-) Transcript_103428:1713-2546(-)
MPTDITSTSNWAVPTMTPSRYMGTMVGTGETAPSPLSIMSALPIFCNAMSHCGGGMRPLPTTSSSMSNSNNGVVGSTDMFKAFFPPKKEPNVWEGCQPSKNEGPNSMITRLFKNIADSIRLASGTLKARPFLVKRTTAVARTSGSSSLFPTCWFEIVTEGNRTLMLCTLLSKTLKAFSIHTTLKWTSASWPSTRTRATTGEGLHMPLTTDWHTAEPIAAAGSLPSSRIATVNAAPTRPCSSTRPKENSSTSSAYSTIPVLNWLLVILSWPFALTLIT